MTIRNRVKELRRVRASELRPNPRNWRMHPDAQRGALEEVLTQIGYADALLARELEDGSLEIIDGHLRAEVTPDELVPVLVLDLDPNEADLLLLAHDPLAGMAEANSEQLAELMQSLELPLGSAVESMLAGLAAASADLETPSAAPPPPPPECKIEELYQVVIACDDEPQQRAIYERLTSEGYQCRVLTL